MATALDLQEQEQIDELKLFWKRWGTALTWLLIGMLAAYAAWNGWNAWQRNQAAKAAALYEQIDKAVQAGDATQAGRVFNDLRDGYPGTVQAAQAGLLAAKIQSDKGRADDALASLDWVAAHAADPEYRTAARLRAAGILLDQKKLDAAAKQLDAADAPTFAALVDDRRGDVLSAQGRRADAVAAWTRAWKAMEPQLTYRRLIEAKLTAAGAAPETAVAAAAAAVSTASASVSAAATTAPSASAVAAASGASR